MKNKDSLVQILVDTEDLDLKTIISTKQKIYSFLNPVSYLEAIKNDQLFNQMDGLFSDGAILSLFVRLFYFNRLTRRSFDMTSLGNYVLSHASKERKSVYIVASRQEQVEKAVSILKDKFRNLNVVGFRNGYFKNEEEKLIEAQHVVAVNPDFLIVGLGIVKQEQFLLLVKQMGFQGIGFTCGGFIHQTSRNKVQYYPQWVDKYNLRFVYRMVVEKHTRKRYLKAALVFPIKFLKKRIGF